MVSRQGNRLSGALCRPFQYILRGTVVLDKVEISRREFFQPVSKVADDSYGFEKDLRQNHR